MDSSKETVHLLYSIRHEHSLEIVTIFQTIADTCCNGINILKHTGIFDTNHICRYLGLDKIACEHIGEGLGFLTIGTAYGKVGETFQCHLLGMRGTTDAGEVVIWNIKYLMEVLGTNEVLVRHDTLDGCDDIFVAQTGLQLF